MSRSTTSHPPCLLRWKSPICLPRTVQPLRTCWWGRDDDLDYCEDNVFEDSFETSRNNNSNSLSSNVAEDTPIRNMIKSMSITEKDDKLVPKQLFNDGLYDQGNHLSLTGREQDGNWKAYHGDG